MAVHTAVIRYGFIWRYTVRQAGSLYRIRTARKNLAVLQPYYTTGHTGLFFDYLNPVVGKVRGSEDNRCGDAITCRDERRIRHEGCGGWHKWIWERREENMRRCTKERKDGWSWAIRVEGMEPIAGNYCHVATPKEMINLMLPITWHLGISGNIVTQRLAFTLLLDGSKAYEARVDGIVTSPTCCTDVVGILEVKMVHWTDKVRVQEVAQMVAFMSTFSAGQYDNAWVVKRWITSVIAWLLCWYDLTSLADLDSVYNNKPIYYTTRNKCNTIQQKSYYTQYNTPQAVLQ
jgi:hypothetical protein